MALAHGDVRNVHKETLYFEIPQKKSVPGPGQVWRREWVALGVHGFTREAPSEQGFERLVGVSQEKDIVGKVRSVARTTCETWAV